MMSDEERKAVIDAVTGAVKRLDVLFNTGCASTMSTIALTKYAKDSGADAATIIVPYYYRQSQGEIAAHFLRVADKTDLPIIAYNIPQYAGNSLKPEMIREFAADERIVGIKESGDDACALLRLIDIAHGGFSVMVGSDNLASYGIIMGAKGLILGGAAIAPDLCIDIYESIVNGDTVKAFSLQQSLAQLTIAMSSGALPTTVKYALKLQGLPAGYVRLPLDELSRQERSEVERRLKVAGIITI